MLSLLEMPGHLLGSLVRHFPLRSRSEGNDHRPLVIHGSLLLVQLLLSRFEGPILAISEEHILVELLLHTGLLNNNSRLTNYWNTSDAFQRKFSQNLVEESVRPLIHSICSVFLIVSRTSGPKDKKIASWLHKQLLIPTIGELIELSIYKYLWEFASTITDTQLRPLKK